MSKSDNQGQNIDYEAIARLVQHDFEEGQRLRALREQGVNIPEEMISKSMSMNNAYRMAQSAVDADERAAERDADERFAQRKATPFYSPSSSLFWVILALLCLLVLLISLMPK